ncbi:MAG: protoporphyrinogen oxidase HemJ [Lentilitoribacter sp.]
MAIASILFVAFLALTWKNENFYLWIKALHIIAVISWMAGMLYLPRLFVYHASEEVGSPVSEKLKIMEFKLLKVIINPAMMVTWGAGLWLMFSGLVDLAGWFWVKFILVLAMSGAHGWLSKSQKRFAADENQLSEKQWRMANEIPTVLMIGIVIMVIVRPF